MRLNPYAVEWFLSQWGLWSCNDKQFLLDFPKFAIFVWAKRKSAGSLIITDSEAMIIDHLVAQLRKQDLMMGDAHA